MNTIKTVLLTILLLAYSVTAFASYAEKFEKNYPDSVTTLKEAEGIESKYYDIYYENNVGVSVYVDGKGNKYCSLVCVFVDSEQKNYTAFKYGKGKKDYTLKSFDEPLIAKLGEKYIETYIVDIDTKLLKKATYISALRKDNKVDYLIPPDGSEINEFKEAIKVAEKILFE